MKKPAFWFLIMIMSAASFGQTVRHPFFTGAMPSLFAPAKIPAGSLQLDSIHGYYFYDADDSALYNVYRYSYDTERNRTLAELSNYYRFQYGYDSYGNLILSQIKVPDEDYEMKTIYSYNENNERVLEKYYWRWDSLNWDSLGNRQILYDENGNLKTETELGSHGNIKDDYTYDSDGLLILFKKYSALESFEPNWQLDSKNEYTYDDNKNLIHVKYYAMNGNPGLYLTMETEYLYNDGIMVAQESHSFNYDGTELYANREEYLYNESGYKTDIFQYNLSGAQWVNSNHQLYIYNPDNSIITSEEYIWWNAEWVGYLKTDYTYDAYGYIIKQVDYNYTNDWVLYQRSYYYYSGEITGTELPEPVPDNRVYPNPSKGTINIILNYPGISELTIYSLDGKLIHRQLVNKGTCIVNLQIQQSGVYLLQIVEEDTIHTQKIVVK